jgi:predicted DCC family thiol-disulfide oxidoreductase YuxK
MAIVTVAYDEDCGACRWFADHLRTLDRSHNLNFVPIQHADQQLLPVPKEHRLDAMHAITSDGRVYTGGAAIPVIARELPAGPILSAVAGASPSLTDRIYRAAAARRTTIGRWLGADACAVDPSRMHDAGV